MRYWLGTKAGWTGKFYHKDFEVTKDDFGTLMHSKKATILSFGSDVEAVIYVDAQNQLCDHLHGQGYVAPDEYPDDDLTFYYSWNCE